jgi:hypothetical protein
MKLDKGVGGSASRTLRWALALVGLAFGLAACGQTVQFSVLRAAKVNVKSIAGEKEPTVSVGRFTANDPSAQAGADEIAQYLRELVTSAEGGVVKFVEARGVVTLNGNLAEQRWAQKVNSKPGKCSTM